MSVGIVAALAAEARTLGRSMQRSCGLSVLRDGTLVSTSGIGAAAATLAAHTLADAGATRLVSWGMAGGLDPALPAGTICVPGSVISREGARFGTDTEWRGQVVAAILRPRAVAGGILLTVARAIEDVAGKAAAFRDTGADVVDMESLAVAQVAAHRGLPFIAVRVVVDTAADRLPDAVLAASGGGEVRIARLLRELKRRPGDLAAVLRLARRYRAATRALVAVARSGALVPVSASASRVA